jgi:hypothetical protein
MEPQARSGVFRLSEVGSGVFRLLSVFQARFGSVGHTLEPMDLRPRQRQNSGPSFGQCRARGMPPKPKAGSKRKSRPRRLQTAVHPLPLARWVHCGVCAVCHFVPSLPGRAGRDCGSTTFISLVSGSPAISYSTLHSCHRRLGPLLSSLKAGAVSQAPSMPLGASDIEMPRPSLSSSLNSKTHTTHTVGRHASMCACLLLHHHHHQSDSHANACTQKLDKEDLKADGNERQQDEPTFIHLCLCSY